MQQIQQSVPDGTVRPIFPSYLSNWLDHLGAYNLWPEERWNPIKLMQLLYETDAFYPYMVPFPTNIVGTGLSTGAGNILNFNPGETQTGSIQVPAGSFLVSAGCYANNGSNEGSKTGAGAKVRIYDKATQSDMFYQQYAHGQDVFGGGSGSNTVDVPFGPHLFASPYIIVAPGVIQWEITNLDPNNGSTIQVLLSFAVPKGSVSGNVLVVEEDY